MNYDPFPGRLIDENGNTVNLVALLGGSSPIPGMIRNPSQYDPIALRLVAEDGTVHNLVDLLAPVTQLPEANAQNLHRIYQYGGESSGQMVHGYFYECIENGGVYSWAPLDFGASPIAAFSGETLVIT